MASCNYPCACTSMLYNFWQLVHDVTHVHALPRWCLVKRLGSLCSSLCPKSQRNRASHKGWTLILELLGLDCCVNRTRESRWTCCNGARQGLQGTPNLFKIVRSMALLYIYAIKTNFIGGINLSQLGPVSVNFKYLKLFTHNFTKTSINKVDQFSISSLPLA